MTDGSTALTWLIAVACAVVTGIPQANAGAAHEAARHEQSLADVARAEAARRKAIAHPSRVYTNKDLLPAPAADGSAAEPGEEEGKGAGATPSHPATAEGRPGNASSAAGDDSAREVDGEDRKRDEEARWRRRMADAREHVERDRMFAEALQSRINALNTDFAARDDPAQRAAIGTELTKALAELARVRREIDEHEKAVGDLEEEARRAQVPPGWLRNE